MDEYIFTNKIKTKLLFDIITSFFGSVIFSTFLFLALVLPFLSIFKITDQNFFLTSPQLGFTSIFALVLFVFIILATNFIKQYFENTFLLINPQGVKYVENDKIIFDYNWSEIKAFRRIVRRKGFNDTIEVKKGITIPSNYSDGLNKEIISIPLRVWTFNGNKMLKSVNFLKDKYNLDIETKTLKV